MSILGTFYKLSPYFECLIRQTATLSGINLTARPAANATCQRRLLSSSQRRLGDENENAVDDGLTDVTGDDAADGTPPTKAIDPRKDRTVKIPVERALKYIESEAYKSTYGDNLVWKLYKRNHKFQFPPRTTRPNCVKNGVIITGNPCPICRDEYLVVDYRNLKLLTQFISPNTDEIIGAYYTGVCQFQHFEIRVAVEKARDFGYLTFSVPHRVYDYDEYYPKIREDILRT